MANFLGGKLMGGKLSHILTNMFALATKFARQWQSKSPQHHQIALLLPHLLYAPKNADKKIVQLSIHSHIGTGAVVAMMNLKPSGSKLLNLIWFKHYDNDKWDELLIVKKIVKFVIFCLTDDFLWL